MTESLISVSAAYMITNTIQFLKNVSKIIPKLNKVVWLNDWIL